MSNMENENLKGEIKSFYETDAGTRLAVVRFDDHAEDASIEIADFLNKNGPEETKKLVKGTRVLVKYVEQTPLGPIASGVKIDDKEMMGKYLGVGEAEANEIDTNTYHGTIEELHDQGWGKIKSDDRNIFFNSSALKGATFDELEIGKKVLFNIVNFDKNGVGKIKAARVQIANKEKENSFRGGVIKTLHERGGKIDFAFIMPEDGGKDIMFVPLRPEDEKALSELERGASVLFEPIMSPKVLKAKTIRIGDKVIMGTVPRETL